MAGSPSKFLEKAAGVNGGSNFSSDSPSMASPRKPTTAQKSNPRKSNPRKSNYTIDEDKHLCQLYMDITQDSETRMYKKKDHLWIRIMEAYNSKKLNLTMADRNIRSLECRMQTILSAVSKFKVCVQQVEDLYQSGSSSEDIHTRAKQLMMSDPKFSKGFKFEHVWSILKDFVKVDGTSQKSRPQRPSSQSDMVPESPSSPNGLSSFSLNVCDDDDGGSASSHLPEGMEKYKLKRKKCEDMSIVVNTIIEEYQKFRDLLESSTTKKDHDIQLQMQKVEAQKQNAAATWRLAEATQWAADTNILIIDIDTISDPNRRKYFKKEQARIISKREEQLH